jgi:hypothetical protein
MPSLFPRAFPGQYTVNPMDSGYVVTGKLEKLAGQIGSSDRCLLGSWGQDNLWYFQFFPWQSEVSVCCPKTSSSLTRALGLRRSNSTGAFVCLCRKQKLRSIKTTCLWWSNCDATKNHTIETFKISRSLLHHTMTSKHHLTHHSKIRPLTDGYVHVRWYIISKWIISKTIWAPQKFQIGQIFVALCKEINLVIPQGKASVYRPPIASEQSKNIFPGCIKHSDMPSPSFASFSISLQSQTFAPNQWYLQLSPFYSSQFPSSWTADRKKHKFQRSTDNTRSSLQILERHKFHGLCQGNY